MCREADVELVLPGDLRREVVLYAMALYNLASGSGWSLAHARQNVSFAVPGTGDAGRLADALPAPLGGILKGLSDQTRRPMVVLSPAALTEGWMTAEATKHELGHIGDVRAGGLGWCAAFGAVPLARAATEAPCYGGSLALAVRLGGRDVDEEATRVRASLRHYGLDTNAMLLAERILDSHVAMAREPEGDPGGVVAEVIEALVMEGFQV